MTIEIEPYNPCQRPTSMDCRVEDYYPDHAHCIGCYYFHPNLSNSKPPEKKEETFMSKEGRDLNLVGKGGGSGNKKEMSEITKLKLANCNLGLNNLQLQANAILRVKERIVLEEFGRLGLNLGEWLVDEKTMEIVVASDRKPDPGAETPPLPPPPITSEPEPAS